MVGAGGRFLPLTLAGGSGAGRADSLGAADGGGDDPGRAEGGRRLGAGAEELAHGRLDIAAVGVGQRPGAAGARADGEGAEIEFGRHRRR